MEDHEFDKTMSRMKKEGGSLSFSLIKGSYIHVNDEKRQTIMEPVEGAKEYFESKKVPEVIYL